MLQIKQIKRRRYSGKKSKKTKENIEFGIRIIGVVLALFTIWISLYQNGLTLKNLEEQQKINNKSIESMNLDRVSKPLIVNLNFDEKETTKLTVFGTENNEPFSVEAPIINIKTIQGAVKDIKAIFADEKSFGIGDFIESKELPEDIEMKNYNMYLRGFSENYRFVRQYFMIEGRDNSRHLYMIAYQIDKDSKIKNKILWS